MRFIFIILLLCNIFSNDIIIDVYPDSIFVGTLVNIEIKVNNITNEEVAFFHDYNQTSDKYSHIDKILSNNSAQYSFQFWDSGFVALPPFTIDISKYNQNIRRITTEEIPLNILTNITTPNAALREIKPMQNIFFTSPIKRLIFIIVLFFSIINCFFFWNRRVKNNTSLNANGKFNKLHFQETLKAIEQLSMPENINIDTTQAYYLKLSEICRIFLKKLFYINATEMTSGELTEYFESIGINKKLIDSWIEISNKNDISKYANNIPHIDQYYEDKNNIITLIKSFNKNKANLTKAT